MIKQVNDTDQISRLVLRGYKSIAECDLELGRLNVLIGANGAGKSNFIGFFRLINRILDQQLQVAVGQAGGPDAVLHFGRKKTEELRAELYFGNNGYRFRLRPTADNRMMFYREALWWNVHGEWHPASGHFETQYREKGTHGRIWAYVVPAMLSWRLYHFHDTSSTALVKQIHSIGDNEYLRDDARNLGAFLLRLKSHHGEHYLRIVKAIRLVAPFSVIFCCAPRSTTKRRYSWNGRNRDRMNRFPPAHCPMAHYASFAWRPFCCSRRSSCPRRC